MKKNMTRKTFRLFCILLSVIMLFSCNTFMAFATDNDFGYVIVTNFIDANSGKDVSDEIQSIIDSNPNRTILFPDGEYLVSKPILTPAEPTKSVSLKLSDYAVIKAVGSWAENGAVIQLGGKYPANNVHTNGSNYGLEGGIIDGNSIANGVSINSGRETTVRNVSIKHTIIGLHIMYGANNGSSDCDITGLNIIGTGTTDSIGVFLEGLDNTLTNIRIGCVYTGVYVNSGGNVLRNIHPLFYSDYADYQNSCGFREDKGNNWYDFCYSDQFGIGFRTTGNDSSIYNNCYCYWYSSKGEKLTAFKADKKFNSILTNFKADFRDDTENCVLSVGKSGGKGTFDNLSVDEELISKKTHRAYIKDDNVFSHVFWLIIVFFDQFV